MTNETFHIFEQNIIIQLQSRVCQTPEEVINSEIFREITKRALDKLAKRQSILLNIFDQQKINDENINILIKTLVFLSSKPISLTVNAVKGSNQIIKDLHLLNEFVEYLYNYWRSYDRFLLANSPSAEHDQRPYRTFNATIGQLTNLIRGMYRDIQENITGQHPRIYRQVAAGAEIATIAIKKNIVWKDKQYNRLNDIVLIRQILIYPPLILNPPINKRNGKFEKVAQNPLDLVEINPSEWLCYPAKVGPLIIFVYFHIKFAELGHALCNLFQLAEEEDLQRQPDAIYFYGTPGDSLDKLGVFPTVFHEDNKNDLLVAAVPGRNEFGYFGYVKKMVLTLHNIIMMKRGRMPFHGAMIKITLKGNKQANILFMGDTGAGKSETLEAFRELGEEYIQDMIIIADDMGSLALDENNHVIGYGTEIGAFLRLDDLKPGYALGQIDRAIIMSPNQVNARIILPVTTFENIMKGYKVDYILYANNYDVIDDEHPIIEKITDVDKALNIFREGTVMSKGTTTSTGLVHSYFANIFGPPQYKELHEPLAKKFFTAFMQQGNFVGQMRTRLGKEGWEREGPIEAAKELLNLIKNR